VGLDIVGVGVANSVIAELALLNPVENMMEIKQDQAKLALVSTTQGNDSSGPATSDNVSTSGPNDVNGGTPSNIAPSIDTPNAAPNPVESLMAVSNSNSAITEVATPTPTISNPTGV